MWHYDPLRINDVCKVEIKVSVYFVTSVFSFILNIVSTNLYHENENKQTDTNIFDLQEIKRVGQSFHVLTFLFFNHSSLNCHLFVFRHYKL